MRGHAGGGRDGLAGRIPPRVLGERGDVLVTSFFLSAAPRDPFPVGTGDQTKERSKAFPGETDRRWSKQDGTSCAPAFCANAATGGRSSYFIDDTACG